MAAAAISHPKCRRKISRPKLPRKPSLLKLIPLKIRSEGRKAEGWRVISRLAGARCKQLERKRRERRGLLWSVRALVLFWCRSVLVLFCSGLVGRRSSNCHGSGRSRCSPGSPLVGRSACHSPPRPHEKAPENPSIPPETPSELSGVRRERRAARAGRGPRRRDSRGGRQVDDAHSGKSPPLIFLWALCK